MAKRQLQASVGCHKTVPVKASRNYIIKSKFGKLCKNICIKTDIYFKLQICRIIFNLIIIHFLLDRFTSRWSKGSAPRPTPSPNFVVSLKVGNKEFVGEGSTAQAAKHSAATKALQTLKVLSISLRYSFDWFQLFYLLSVLFY